MIPDEDVCIEGMVLGLLREIHDRGYKVPPGLVEQPPDMDPGELATENYFYASFMRLPRHLAILEEHLPRIIPSDTTHNSVNGTAETLLEDSDSKSALFFSGLLSLLITLQAEFVGEFQETDTGVVGELVEFKARRKLAQILYTLATAVLDSYLAPEKHSLLTLLFHDYPLTYDSFDCATSPIDLLLTLSSYPLVEAEHLIKHPAVLATTEYVWRNGLKPPPHRGFTKSWSATLCDLDRFSMPRILHTHTYVLSTAHSALTIYILMFSAWLHFDSFNPLAPDGEVRIPETGRLVKSSSLVSSILWILWVGGTCGWAMHVARVWMKPSLPLSPSTLLPLIHHALVFFAFMLRFVLLFLPTNPPLILASSLTMLAWSVPFLAASRILPQNLPSFGTPQHFRWNHMSDGKRGRHVGYRPPPKTVPESHRSLRQLEAHLGGLIQFSSYFFVFGFLLLWSLSGELDYPDVIYPLLRFRQLAEKNPGFTVSSTLSPIEARTSLAFTLVLGVALGYFAGGRPSVTASPFHSPNHTPDGLEDLDGWDRYGREVSFRARRERLAICRYFTFVPPPSSRPMVSLQSAWWTPPLPAPFNLFIPLLVGLTWLCRTLRQERIARRINERGRLWVWRSAMLPLAGWAVLAKISRKLTGAE